jgi:hypothetical protein
MTLKGTFNWGPLSPGCAIIRVHHLQGVHPTPSPTSSVGQTTVGVILTLAQSKVYKSLGLTRVNGGPVIHERPRLLPVRYVNLRETAAQCDCYSKPSARISDIH